MFVGDPCLAEDFLSPPITNSPGPWSPFSTQTAGDHSENYAPDCVSPAKKCPAWKISTNVVWGICDQYQLWFYIYLCEQEFDVYIWNWPAHKKWPRYAKLLGMPGQQWKCFWTRTQEVSLSLFTGAADQQNKFSKTKVVKLLLWKSTNNHPFHPKILCIRSRTFRCNVFAYYAILTYLSLFSLSWDFNVDQIPLFN